MLRGYRVTGGTKLLGHAPEVIPLCMAWRESYLVVGSDIREWSFASRCLMKIATKRKRIRMLAASKFCQELVKSHSGRDCELLYARVTERVEVEEGSDAGVRSKRIRIVITNARDFAKGYLDTLIVASQMKELVEIAFDVYGAKGKLYELECLGEVVYRARCDEPFKQSRELNKDERLLYIGMSKHEGLHLAVVEAAAQGYAVVLSDIPAHRELESLGGVRLLIGQNGRCVRKGIENLVTDRREYTLYTTKCQKLASRFRKETLNDESLLRMFNENVFVDT